MTFGMRPRNLPSCGRIRFTKSPYGSLIEELKEGLTESLDEPVPVFTFGYDWRQPLDDIERRFEAFVQEVLDRTSLLRHYHDDTEGFGKQKKVNLVGHSMGGLIITEYLQRKGKELLCIR